MNKRKETYIYDLEIFYNYFQIGLYNYKQKYLFNFEVNEKIDQREEIYNFFINLNDYLVGFNSVHYDNVLIKYFLKNYDRLKNLNVKDFLYELKSFSNSIIEDDYDKIKYYKWFKINWVDIDLYLFWSKMLRMSKKLSLKSLGIQLGHKEVQELPYPHDKLLTFEEMDNIKYYNNVNDIGISITLFEKMRDQILQRNDAIQKFSFDNSCYSWDGVKLGQNILLKEYCLENNISLDEIINLRTEFPSEGIAIKDILLPKINFKETEVKIYNTTDKNGNTIYNCNSFFTLFNHLKERRVYSTKDLHYSVYYKNVKYDIKSGGLHSWHENEIVNPDLKLFIYRDIDVSSYYPTLGSEYGFVPRHLPGMDKVIKRIKTMRLKYKSEGNKKDAELYKLALNGGYYGNLNNGYSPMYDPLQLLSVTVNGQMFLLMLCEWLDEEGIIIDMCNTDGVTVIIPKDKESVFREIYHRWEKLTLMELEEVNYIKVIRKNINNYIAVSDNGKIKRKGLFKFGNEIPLGDSVDEEVVAKSLDLFFTKNIPIEESICNPQKYGFHIYDYCCSNKISKSYHVIHNDKKIQNLNRYYFSKKEPYLFKVKKTKSTLEHVNVGEGVKLFNKYEEKNWEEYDINYQYYINKAREIINSFLIKSAQLTLF